MALSSGTSNCKQLTLRKAAFHPLLHQVLVHIICLNPEQLGRPMFEEAMHHMS